MIVVHVSELMSVRSYEENFAFSVIIKSKACFSSFIGWLPTATIPFGQMELTTRRKMFIVT